MNLYVSLILFSVIVLIYWIISEMFTILFRFTGLPDERARFQVISLLTGCGFTTRESEMVMATKRRRRLAGVTMLFGYVFNITVISALINVFFSLKLAQEERFLVGLIIPLAAVAVIFVFMRVPAVRAWGDKKLEQLADRVIRHDASNTVTILDYIGHDSIILVSLKTVPESLREKTLAQMELRAQQNILVMLIQKVGKQPAVADGFTVFEKGDKITVFGEYKTICDTFNAKENFSDPEEKET